MPATHSASSAATNATRRFMIGRQSCVAWVTGGVIGSSAPRDDRGGRRLRRDDAFDDDRLVARRRDEVQLVGGERLDPLRRLERVDLELEAARDVLLGGALALQLLHLVAVAQQLEVLPGRDQEDEHEEAGDADRLPQLALPRLVDLADDRVVADVFLDGVLERFHQAILSAARSLALRARGLRSTSSSPAISGFLVSTCTSASRCCRARSVCLTMRSSRE